MVDDEVETAFGRREEKAGMIDGHRTWIVFSRSVRSRNGWERIVQNVRHHHNRSRSSRNAVERDALALKEKNLSRELHNWTYFASFIFKALRHDHRSNFIRIGEEDEEEETQYVDMVA